MRLVLIFSTCLSFLAGCGSKSTSSSGGSSGWSDVNTILVDNCSSCHTASTNDGNCGHFMTSETLYKAAQACTETANTPAARIALTTGALKMPPSTTLTTAQIKTLTDFK